MTSLIDRARIYEIKKRLKFDDAVIAAGNPPTLHPSDRHELIDELDALYEKQRRKNGGKHE